MRTILALFIGAALFAAPAFSECCCEYNTVGPNGQRVSVVSSDGYYMQNGKVMLFRNGGISELTQEATLDDGSRLLVDGTVVLRDGSRRRLNNNQWIFVDGRFSEGIGGPSAVAFTDGYMRENGKTFVFRNGNRTEVTSDMTFDNGTLQADGTIIMRDGSRKQLREGQRMAFNGQIQEVSQSARPSEPNAQNVSRDRFNENNNPNNAQPNNANKEEHRDRGATQSNKETQPSKESVPASKEEHRDRGATQAPDKPVTPSTDQPAGRGEQNKTNSEPAK